jgi:uncharacterized protein (TIGR04222 family)
VLKLQGKGELHKGMGLVDPIERDLSRAVSAKRFNPRTWEEKEAGWESLQHLKALRRQLEERGLLLREPQRRQATLGPVLVVALVLGLGLLRLIHGWLVGRPIGFLLLLCLALMGMGVLFASQPPRRTARGEELLERRRRGIQGRTQRRELEAALAAVAVLGLVALPPAQADSIRLLITPVSGRLGGEGGASGDGGGCGGGGGGGGGCGGCGG